MRIAEGQMGDTESRRRKSKIEVRRFQVSSKARRIPQSEFSAVIFDLLGALLNSWKLWNEVAGSDESGLRWRNSPTLCGR